MTTIKGLNVTAMARAAYTRHQRHMNTGRQIDWDRIGVELQTVWIDNILAALGAAREAGLELGPVGKPFIQHWIPADFEAGRINGDAPRPLPAAPIVTGSDPGRPGGDHGVEVKADVDGKGGIARILDVREHVVLRQDEVPAQTHGSAETEPRRRGVRFRDDGTGRIIREEVDLPPEPTSRFRWYDPPPAPGYMAPPAPRLQQFWLTGPAVIPDPDRGMGGEWRDVPVVSA